MGNTTLTTAEHRLKIVMWASVLMYGSWGLTCMLMPSFAEMVATTTGALLVEGKAVPLQPSFWEPLADGAMASLIACSFFTARDPRKNWLMVVPILASKTIGSLFAGVLCLRGDCAPSVVAMLLTDIPILVVTGWVWWAARPEKLSV